MINSNKKNSSNIKKNNKFDCIFFDIGETLIDNQRIIEASANSAFMKLETMGFLRDSKTWKDKYLKLHSGPMYLYSSVELAKKIFKDNQASNMKLIGLFLTYFRQNVNRNLRPKKSMLSMFETLKSFKKGIGVISNGFTNEQLEQLVRLKIIKFIDICLISEDVGIRKPSRKIFEIAASLAKTPPSKLLMVGNSFHDDLLPAKEVGFKTMLLKNDFDYPSDFRRLDYIDYVAKSFSDVVEVCCSRSSNID